MAKPKYWWIKERHNPQLGVYYVALGQITVREAKAMENALYGDNILHRFSTKEAYNTAMKKFASK